MNYTSSLPEAFLSQLSNFGASLLLTLLLFLGWSRLGGFLSLGVLSECVVVVVVLINNLALLIGEHAVDLLEPQDKHGRLGFFTLVGGVTLDHIVNGDHLGELSGHGPLIAVDFSSVVAHGVKEHIHIFGNVLFPHLLGISRIDSADFRVVAIKCDECHPDHFVIAGSCAAKLCNNVFSKVEKVVVFALLVLAIAVALSV